MAQVPWQPVLIVLLMSCLGSFAWAMRYFFARPEGVTRAMRITTGVGSLFSVVHLLTLALTPEVKLLSGCAAALTYFGSLSLFWWTIRTNRHSPLSAVFSSDLPVHLIEKGPYRFVRHPFYCSYLATWVAGFVATWTWWLLATVFVMLALYIHAARLEERKFAQSPLRDAYASYRCRTGMFVPDLWKWLRSRRDTGKTDSDMKVRDTDAVDGYYR